jgi:hypothetical protein
LIFEVRQRNTSPTGLGDVEVAQYRCIDSKLEPLEHRTYSKIFLLNLRSEANTMKKKRILGILVRKPENFPKK